MSPIVIFRKTFEIALVKYHSLIPIMPLLYFLGFTILQYQQILYMSVILVLQQLWMTHGSYQTGRHNRPSK